MRLIWWGYYGHNYGDDVMLDVIIDHCIASRNDFEIIDKFDGRLEEKLKHKKVKVYNWKNNSKISNFKKILDISKPNTLNIWGGGTIFTDTEGDGNYKLFNLIRKIGGKYAYIGVGIGDLSVKERVTRTKKLLKGSEFVSFRDEKSLSYGRNLTINKNQYLAEDISYIFFSKKKQELKFKTEDYILISWRNLENYLPKHKEKNVMDQLVKSANRLCKEKGINEIKLINIDNKKDVEGTWKLMNMLQKHNLNVKVVEDSDLDTITEIVGSSKFHFSGRLHGSVASEFLNVPTLTLSYSNKIEYFYKSINKYNYINILEDDIQYSKVIDAYSGVKKGNFSSKLELSNKSFQILEKVIYNEQL